ncbi:hypothetical protein HPB49_007796 [Dermacentor silvarum]|uniref:Uncharacterized protein n=1 Tax=Dermacentor silvarum TaxID=543639 RepID=A0ACB8CQF2_DERSI|nr:hypothetical protein HPB49_007796 [Dermacentor silvarum]
MTTRHESWVELYYGASSSASERATPPLTGNMHILEKLLLEAQRDSNVSSARGSGRDWNFRHPASVGGIRKRPVLSLRGSRIIRLADIFPLLLLSNILSILLGAGIGVCIGRRMRVANVE